MERHGDFDPAIDDSMENARLTLTLVAPNIPRFDSDFQTFYNRIRILVDLLDPLANLHPLVTQRQDANDIVLNFSHKLFQVSTFFSYAQPLHTKRYFLGRNSQSQMVSYSVLA